MALIPPPPPPRRRAISDTEIPDAQLRDPVFRRVYARMLAEYLPTYCTEVLRGPPEYGGRFLVGPHHMEWGDVVAAGLSTGPGRILALAARDHGKSHAFCFGMPLWLADRRAPGRLGYIFSATREQAAAHLEKIRQEVIGGGEHGGANPRLAHLLPLKRDKAHEIVFANGSTIRARGFGSRVRGGHPYWIVCDDVGNDEWIWSDKQRTKSVDYFLSAIEPMVVPGGLLVVVGTPFHATDLYHHLEETGIYRVLRHPAICPDGSALWPARYDLERLAVKRRLLGSSIRWSREFLCQPISDEASLFPSWLFDAPGIRQPYPLGLPAAVWRDRGIDTFMGVDLAMSSSAAADFLVCFVLGVDSRNGDRYVVDIIRRKGLGYQEQIDVIVNASKKYGCGLIFCEANQYQRVITDLVVRTSDVPIKAFYTLGREAKKATTVRRGMKQTYNANKNALDQGVPSLRMLLENGKLRVPWDPSTRETVQVWLNEMQAFGFAEGKLQGVGAHDDTVLALWMADRASAVGGAMRDAFDSGMPAAENGNDVPAFDPLGGEDDVDFFGGGGSGPDDWRPREGVGIR